MDRKGVAATLVSVVFFSTLLLANAAIYAAGGTYLSDTLMASAQHREFEYAPVLAGLSAFSSLSAAETYLASNPMNCSSGPAYTGSMGGTAYVGGDDGGLVYNASSTWSYTADDQMRTNSTILGAFGGYSGGALNLLVTTTFAERTVGGLPSYQGQVVQMVHLPIETAALTSFCLSTLALMRQSLSSLPSCNSTSVQEALDSLTESYPYLGSASMGGTAQESGSTCNIDYWVTIAQGYEGVSGPSYWSVYDAQSFSI